MVRWRNWLGAVLALGLFYRAAIHVLAALATDSDPHLDDEHDVRLASPVPSIRGSRADLIARLGSAGSALIVAGTMGHLVAPSTFLEQLGAWWLAVNWYVLLFDPLLGGSWIWWHADRIPISYVR